MSRATRVQKHRNGTVAVMRTPERPLSRILLAASSSLVAVLLLQGCTSGSSDKPITGERPVSSSIPPMGEDPHSNDSVDVLAPVLVSEDQDNVSASVGATIVLLQDDPSAWGVSATPDGVVEVLPGGEQDGYTTNTALLALIEGTTVVRLENVSTGTVRTVQVTVTGSLAMQVAAALPGLTLEQAEMLAESAGVVIRTVELDGESMIVTEDYRTDRVNVVIVDELITDATVG